MLQARVGPGHCQSRGIEELAVAGSSICRPGSAGTGSAHHSEQ